MLVSPALPLLLLVYCCLMVCPCLSLQCPTGCNCATNGGKETFLCTIGDAKYYVSGNIDHDVTIRCLESTVTCQNLPAIPLAFNSTLSLLVLQWCGIPDLACVVTRLGAWAVESIALEHPKELLRADHLAGLRGVKTFRMRMAALQTSVPYEAIASLPSLQDFCLHDAPVTLWPPPQPVTLHTLELGMTSIVALPPAIFSNMPHLTTLRLFSNDIDNISVGAFEGLDNLLLLDLSQNPIRVLQPGALQHSPRLAHLHLVAARLPDLTARVLEGLRLLEDVQIMFGSPLTLHSGAFSSLPSLKSLLIKETALYQLPPDLFHNSPAVTSIRLIKCKLQEIPDQLFQDQANMMTLSLKDNEIAVLPETMFRTLKSLKHLDLSNNMIQVLTDNLLAGLHNLQTFDASNNKLTFIVANAFYGAVNLQLVTLSNNSLTLTPDPVEELNASPFKTLTELQYLDLSRNNISLVMDDWRLSLIHKIRHIDLSWNNISVLKAKDTIFHGKQLTVNFRNNSITTIEYGAHPDNAATLQLGGNPYNCDCDLYPILNYTRTQATKLNLDSAVCATPQLLKDKPLLTLPLEYLSCNVPDCPEKCNCSIIPATSSINIDCVFPPLFYPQPYLNDVNLKLQHLEQPLKLPNQVVSLDISNINLTSVPDLPETLQVIDLRFNQLATIPQEITRRNVTLYISGNPLECICAYKDDFVILFGGGAVIADLEKATCIDGELLQSVSASHFCDIWWAGALGGLLAVIGLTLAIMAFFIYSYNEEIKRFILKQGWDLFIYEEEIDGKKYDVLVSYADDQEKFVVQKLVPNLVEQGFKVTARYKDWDIGDWIPAKVVGLVEDSRRTLVLLTKSYSESIARLEMSAARLYESRQKRRRMVFVVMDETELETTPLVDAKKCLKWKDPRFWEELRKVMPKRRVKKNQNKMAQATLNVLMTSRGKVLFQCDKPT